jgi:ubiquinone/menaquinone biosynthesis C-methylase UbiE
LERISLSPSRTSLTVEARQSAYLSETIAAYDRISAAYARRFAAADLREHRLRFQSKLGTRAAILDAGCGAGRDCALFEEAGFTPIGVDLSSGLLREARQVTRAPLVLGDVRSLPFWESSFQGVWCCAVLVHLTTADTLKALREMARILVPGSPIFVAVRPGEGNEWRSDDDDGSTRRWFRRFSEPELLELLDAAGFVQPDTLLEQGVATAEPWLNVHARRR